MQHVGGVCSLLCPSGHGSVTHVVCFLQCMDLASTGERACRHIPHQCSAAMASDWYDCLFAYHTGCQADLFAVLSQQEARLDAHWRNVSQFKDMHTMHNAQ
eukprot:scpid45202/ scgid33036/ 